MEPSRRSATKRSRIEPATAGGKAAIMRALYVSIDKSYAPGTSLEQLHDHAVGELPIAPAVASGADLLVPVLHGRPVGVAWQIRGAIHGLGAGDQSAIVVTMGRPVSVEGIVPETAPEMPYGVAVADLVLAA